jgi:hypothetical protein
MHTQIHAREHEAGLQADKHGAPPNHPSKHMSTFLFMYIVHICMHIELCKYKRVNISAQPCTITCVKYALVYAGFHRMPIFGDKLQIDSLYTQSKHVCVSVSVFAYTCVSVHGMYIHTYICEYLVHTHYICPHLGTYTHQNRRSFIEQGAHT